MGKKKYQTEYGRYRVEANSNGEATIFVREHDSTFFVQRSGVVEDVTDLGDLFIAIGSVLHEVNNDK